MPETPTLRVAVIGAGPAGLAAGRELLSKGFSDFTIFDAAVDKWKAVSGDAEPVSTDA